MRASARRSCPPAAAHPRRPSTRASAATALGRDQAAHLRRLLLIHRRIAVKLCDPDDGRGFWMSSSRRGKQKAPAQDVNSDRLSMLSNSGCRLRDNAQHSG
ncbi:unnamed protein product [Urochloa humidicola]